MSEIEFKSIKEFFDEIDNKYEKNYKKEKGEKGKVTNGWS